MTAFGYELPTWASVLGVWFTPSYCRKNGCLNALYDDANRVGPSKEAAVCHDKLYRDGLWMQNGHLAAASRRGAVTHILRVLTILRAFSKSEAMPILLMLTPKHIGISRPIR